MAEKILDHIQSLSATEADLKELLAYLNKTDKTLGRDPRNVDALLGHIDPSIYSLAFSYLLSYKSSLEIPDHHLFAQQAIALLNRAEPKQIKFNATYLVNVCFQFVRSCGFLNRHAAAIRPLFNAIQLLQQGKPTTLTSVHSQFVYACLKAKCYDLAASVLDQPVFGIQPDYDNLAPEDYLSYFYYGGLVYIGLKKFDKALDFFQVALTTPSTVLSAIQIRSYQKMVLVGLITNGELVDLPTRITSPVVQRNVDKLCVVYTKFAAVFLKGVQHAAKFLEDNKEIFKKENNYGLAKQTLAASVRRQIKRLTSTYVSLPLSDLAQRAGLASAEQAEIYVRRMVEEGQILARINQQAGVVSFQETTEQYNSSAAVALLDSKIKEAARLTELVRQADKTTQVHPNYVQKLLKAANEKAGGGPPGHGRGMADMDDDPELAAALRASMQS